MRSRSVLVAILFACALPGVASAKEDDGLLEHLSGPGPFVRIGWEYRLLCLSRPTGATSTQASWMHPWDLGATAEYPRKTHDTPATVDGRAHADCAADRNVSGYLTVAYGHYFSLENNLFPSNLTSDQFKVKADSTSIRFMARVHNAVDVGTGASVFWFHGPAFDSFVRLGLEPARISVAPFAAITDSPRGRAVTITLAPTLLLGGLTQDDFCTASRCGGVPRPFESKAEIVWATTVGIDVVTLFHKGR